MPARGLERADNVTEALSRACETFARLSRVPVNPLTRSIITKRLLASAESGEENPSKWVEAALGGFVPFKDRPRSGRGSIGETPRPVSLDVSEHPATAGTHLHSGEGQERGDEIRRRAQELATSQGTDWAQLSKEERKELKKRVRGLS
jgi:hypothetical protein